MCVLVKQILRANCKSDHLNCSRQAAGHGVSVNHSKAGGLPAECVFVCVCVIVAETRFTGECLSRWNYQ